MMHKNYLKVDQRLNIIPKTKKTSRGKQRKKSTQF